MGVDIRAYLVSCRERDALRAQTLRELAATDWGEDVRVVLDDGAAPDPAARLMATYRRVLASAVSDGSPYLLVLEDDLVFNSSLRHNLQRWRPLRESDHHFLASLYNPYWTLTPPTRDAFAWTRPELTWGSQALLLSRETARFVLEHWDEEPVAVDLRVMRLAARVTLIYYHVPSLVQHMGRRSVIGSDFHWSLDFDPAWRAGDTPKVSTPPPAVRRPPPEVSLRSGAGGAGVVWTAPLFDTSGYADEARNFVLALDRAGLALRAEPIEWSAPPTRLSPRTEERLRVLLAREVDQPYVRVRHCMPRYFRRDPAALRTIGRTMFETDRVPPLWVQRCNELDEIWVPSEFNVETFARAGVSREKLHAVPGGLPVELYDPLPAPLLLDWTGDERERPFVFLSVFGWSLRKGWDVLVRAFVEEFGPAENVLLALHVAQGGSSVARLRALLDEFVRRSVGRDPARIPPIRLLDAELGMDDMPRLYRAADAFVLPSRGEGWGRPYMEAMAAGLPTIGTRWGGQLAFMNDDNAYLVDRTLVDVPAEAVREAPYFNGHRWAEPSVEDLRHAMRRVVERREEAAAKAARGRAEVLSRYSWHAIAQVVADRLANAGAPPRASLAPRPRPLEVVWEGSQFAHHSFAVVNRGLCRELARSPRIALSLDTDTRFDTARWSAERYREFARLVRQPSRGADVRVRHRWPPRFEPPSEGRLVLVQPWELGSLPKAWVAAIGESVEEIWVPSTFVRDSYVRSGIPTSKLAVVPNGVDPERFHPDAPPLALPTRKRFRFLYVGGTIFRKGADIVLDTYLELFGPGDDVCLVIKDSGVDSFYRGQTLGDEIRRAREQPGAPEILYFGGDMPEDGIPRLYTACDALVHPYRAEGFGLPILEAMACGLPVIVPYGGACVDYCDPSVCYFVPAGVVRAREARIGDLETVAPPWWLEVDRSALARAMLRVLQRPQEAREVGARASRKVRAEFTWERAAAIALERLEGVAARAPARSPAAQRWSGTEPAARAASGARLSVCLIERDEEESLPRALESVRGLADEVVVVDTGSTDRTVEIARQHGAAVHRYAWNDDWAAARNESLRRATGDWILVLDADQTLDESGRPEVRRLIEAAGADLVGYFLRQLNYTSRDGVPAVLEHLTLRLFPNHPELRYSGRIHEQLLPQRADLPFRAVPTSVVLHHRGYRTELDEPRRKAERDLPALEALVRDQPAEPFHAYNLGVTHLVLGRNAEGARELLRAIGLSAPHLARGARPPYLEHAHLALALALLELGDNAGAAAACRGALALAPDFSDAHCTLAVAETRQGRYQEALVEYRRAMECQEGPAYAPTDRATREWKALLGMGEVYLLSGRHGEARGALERAAALSPGNPAVAEALARVPASLAGEASGTEPREGSPARKTVSVCMMVKNEERLLGRCLESVRELADELVVVDTGSTDRTVEIARSFGATVHRMAWTHDFAAPQNEALRHATGDWILALDGDNWLDAASRAEIRRLIEAVGEDDEVGYLLRHFSYMEDEGDAMVVEHLALRLFPNRPHLRFVGRMHAQVKSLRPDRPLSLVPCGAVIHHEGYRPKHYATRERLERDRLGLEELAREEPDEPFHAFNLANVYRALGRDSDAERELRRVIARCAPRAVGQTYPHYLVNAYLLLALTLIPQDRLAEAAGTCAQALLLAPAFSDAHCALAVIHARAGNYQAALGSYESALRSGDGPAYVATDRATAGWKALLGMGEVYLLQGRNAEAREVLARARAQHPTHPMIRSALAQAERLLSSASVSPAAS